MHVCDWDGNEFGCHVAFNYRLFILALGIKFCHFGNKFTFYRHMKSINSAYAPFVGTNNKVARLQLLTMIESVQLH